MNKLFELVVHVFSFHLIVAKELSVTNLTERQGSEAPVNKQKINW